MANLVKIGTKVCTRIFKPRNVRGIVKNSCVTNPAIRTLSSHEANIGLIRRTAILNPKRSVQLYDYLPQCAQENFSTLLSAGTRLGYVKVDKNGKILGKSLERFLTVFDRDSYSKMVFLEQNFKGLDKVTFKKLLNAFKTPQKMAENKQNIQRFVEIKDQLRKYSETIAAEGKKQVQTAKQDIYEIFGVMPEARSKGVESIYDKLSRNVLKGKNVSDISSAKAQIGDLVGTRLVLEDVSEKSIQKVVDNLCKGIESGRIKITEIENYTRVSEPYFSKAQFEQIKKAAAKSGVEIKTLKHVKRSASGYVTAQMDIVYSNGARGELQIRGKRMNKYGEAEHIPYDIRQGKNLGKNIPELEQFFQPYEDAVISLKRNKLDKIYDNYIVQCYKYIRKFEKAKIKGKFELPQFPRRLHGYEILRFDNLEKAHINAEKLKDSVLAKAA